MIATHRYRDSVISSSRADPYAESWKRKQAAATALRKASGMCLLGFYMIETNTFLIDNRRNPNR